MAKYWQESPPILQEFLNYHASILSHSAKQWMSIFWIYAASFVI